jgi:RNA polymerase sigma-70 factor (ECF subfamily)
VNPAPAAFRQQLIGHIPRLRRYARTLVFERHRADDLVQATLERGLTHWHQYDQRRDMLVWLLSIAHNAHLDGRRRDRRGSTIDGSGGPAGQCRTERGGDPGADVAPAAGPPGRAGAGCRAEQRESLLLVCVEQLSYAEAAAVMHVPTGTVMSRVCRARAGAAPVSRGWRAQPARAAAEGPVTPAPLPPPRLRLPLHADPARTDRRAVR